MTQDGHSQAKGGGHVVSTIDALANAPDLEPTEKMPAVEHAASVFTVESAERPEFDVSQIGEARWSVHVRSKASQVHLGLPIRSVQRVDAKELIKYGDQVTARTSYRPPWMKARFLPRIIPRRLPPPAQRMYDWNFGIKAGLHEGQIVSDNLMYAELAEKNWPWCTIGQVTVFSANGHIDNGSAVLVGPNLILTAAHLIPWNSPSGSWTMLFRPSYRATDPNPAPFGTSWVEHVYGYVTGKDDVNAHDYVVAKLQTPLGKTVGWMGSQNFGDDDEYRRSSWLSVGYPGDSGMPILASDVRVVDVDSSGAGRELETSDFLLHGWSGGPLIGFDRLDPYVLGIASGSETEFSLGWTHFTETHSVFAGGKPMVDLVKHGYATWPV